MITLLISETVEGHHILLEKLQKLSLDSAVISSPRNETPLLQHGHETYSGYRAILAYLLQLQNLYEQWNKLDLPQLRHARASKELVASL